MASTNKLHEFPAEMIAAIAANLDRNTLLAFRAVCRKWHIASDHVFLEVFFTKRTHLYSRFSLEVLHSISKEPRFATRIKDIKFVNQAAVKRGSESTSQNRHRTSGTINPGDRYCTLPWHSFEPREGTELLVETFDNLSKHDASISLTVANFASEDIFGWREYVRTIGLEHTQEDFAYYAMPADHDMEELIINALAKSQISLQSLSIGYGARGWSWAPSDAAEHMSFVGSGLNNNGNLLKAFSNLKTLKWKICERSVSYASDWIFADETGTGIGIQEIFHNATDLQELSLKANSRGATYNGVTRLFDLDYLSTLHDLPKLKKLELDQMNVSTVGSNDLRRFIRCFSPTLQHIRLARLFLWGPVGWMPVIADLAELPHLESMAIFLLDTSDPFSGLVNLKKRIASEEMRIAKEPEAGANGELSFAPALKRSGLELLATELPFLTPPALGVSEEGSEDIRVHQPASLVEEDGDEGEWLDLIE